MELRRRLTVSFGTSGAIQLLSVVTGVLLARELGPHDRGALAAVLLWPSLLAALGSLGLADATTFHAARGVLRRGTLAATATAIGALQAVVLVAVGLVLAPLVLGRYGSHVVAVGLAALGFVPVYLLTLYLMNILNGLQRTTVYQALRLLIVVATAGSLVGLAATQRLTLGTAVGVQVGAHALAGLVAALLVLRSVDGPLAVDRSAARALLAFGLRSHPTGIAAALNERLDQALISLFLAPALLGLYVVAVTLTSLTGLVASSVTIVALPAVARGGDARERALTARRCVTLAAGASLVATLPVLLLAPRLIELFFGHAYVAAGTVARVLLVAAVVLATSRAMATVLTGLGRPLEASLPELGGLVVTAAALAALLPTLGLLGAGIASLVAYSATFLWLLYRTARALGVGIRPLPVAVEARS